MTIPGFAAEASLGKTRGNYIRMSGASAETVKVMQPSSVAPQFSTAGLGAWWLQVPDLFCPSPFCGRDDRGNCHCHSVMSTI